MVMKKNKNPLIEFPLKWFKCPVCESTYNIPKKATLVECNECGQIFDEMVLKRFNLEVSYQEFDFITAGLKLLRDQLKHGPVTSQNEEDFANVWRLWEKYHDKIGDIINNESVPHK